MTLEEVQIACAAAAAAGIALLLGSLGLALTARRTTYLRLKSYLAATDPGGPSAPPRKETEQPDVPKSGRRWSPDGRASSLGVRIGEWLASAGMAASPAKYVFASVAMPGIIAGMVLVATQKPMWAVASALLGLYLPRWYVEARRKDRLRAFSAQLADTISLLVGGMQAGLSLSQAVQVAARESAEPTRTELAQVTRNMELGLTVAQALQRLSVRIRNRDLDLLVTALEVQREVGGDAVAMLESMAEVIRQRARLKAELRAISAQQRLAARVMFSMPAAIGLLLFLVSPQYMGEILSDEALLCGLPVYSMVFVAAALLGVGYWTVGKAGEIQV